MTELEDRPEFEKPPFTSADGGLSRIAVLWLVAKHYRQLTDPLNGPGGVRGDGGSPMLTPHEPYCLLLEKPPLSGREWQDNRRCTCAYRTVREFERLCRRMREDRSEPLRLVDGAKHSVRALYWHLSAWHLRCERVLVVPPLKVPKAHKGKLLRLPLDDDGRALPHVRVLRDRQASERLALAAVEWQAEKWGLQHEPMLPAALLEPIRVAA